jgi:hypothetical protein
MRARRCTPTSCASCGKLARRAAKAAAPKNGAVVQQGANAQPCVLAKSLKMGAMGGIRADGMRGMAAAAAASFAEMAGSAEDGAVDGAGGSL